MTDEISTIPVESTGNQRIPVDPERASPGVEPAEKSSPAPKEDKPDLDTALKRAFDKANENAKAKNEAKADPEPKAKKVEAEPEETAEASEEEKPAKAERERGPDGKFAPKEPKEPSAQAEQADGSGQDGEAETRPSEGRDSSRPPARFLPRAQEKWANVPHVVKEEIHRWETETARELEEHREAARQWHELKAFDEMARQSGTSVKDAMTNFVNINNLLRQNPVAGVERVLASVGITPQQYAQHILGQQRQPGQPQQQANSEVAALKQQIAQMQHEQRTFLQQQQEQQVTSQMVNSVIEPFRQEVGADNYDYLEPHIAKLLNSGMIPSNLSERQRLEEAYWMADRLYASSTKAPRQSSAPASKPLVDPAGQKSVTGAPTPGLSTKTAAKGDAKDLDAILRRSLAKATAR